MGVASKTAVATTPSAADKSIANSVDGGNSPSTAGNGGGSTKGNHNNDDEDTKMARLERKNASSWDLDDCRSWLLDIARIVAQRWVNEREKQQQRKTQQEAAINNKSTTTTTSTTATRNNTDGKTATTGSSGSTMSDATTLTEMTAKIPEGSKDELEGRLVSHSFNLC